MKRRSSRGFTLIELLISMVLGLIVVGGVISVMLANKRSYRTNEGLAQIQESARSAFELMARDIRQGGGNGCDNNNRTSELIDAGGEWWSTWFGIAGFDGATTDTAVADGTTVGTRIAGTDSIHVQSVQGTVLPLNIHNAGATTLRINAASTPYAAGDFMLICDIDHAAMFEATGYDAGTRTITHAASGMNCSSGLGFPSLCDGGAGNLYAFPINSQVGRVASTVWFIGSNDRPEEGGRSLYRIRIENSAAAAAPVPEEIVAGVTDMQLRYGMNGSPDIMDGDDPGIDWARVNSVFITLMIDSADTNISTDTATNSGRIQRPFNYLITLRNRVP